MPTLTAAQISGIDKSLRQYQLETGGNFSDFLQTLLDVVYGGAIGIAASAAEVDAVAKNAGVCVPGTHSGLNFVYGSGRISLGYSSVAISAGSVLLSASATNYVEVDRAGTVTANTTAFTAGRAPLYVVTTSGSAVATTTNAKQVLMLLGDRGVNGKMLSAAAATKEIVIPLGTIGTGAGSTPFTVTVPKTISGGVVTAASFSSCTALAASNTNYIAIGLYDRDTDGTGVAALVDDTASANTTKTTGGSALVAKARRDLTLATLTGGSERNVVAGQVLEGIVTVTGTLGATLVGCSILVEVRFDN